MSEQEVPELNRQTVDFDQVPHGPSDGDLLARTGVIKVETCFIPFRKQQKLFSQVDLHLREFGFDLLHYEVESGQIRAAIAQNT